MNSQRKQRSKSICSPEITSQLIHYHKKTTLLSQDSFMNYLRSKTENQLLLPCVHLFSHKYIHYKKQTFFFPQRYKVPMLTAPFSQKKQPSYVMTTRDPEPATVRLARERHWSKRHVFKRELRFSTMWLTATKLFLHLCSSLHPSEWSNQSGCTAIFSVSLSNDPPPTFLLSPSPIPVLCWASHFISVKSLIKTAVKSFTCFWWEQ